MEEPKIKYIKLDPNGYSDLMIFHGTGLYWFERPTADELIERIRDIKEKHPELTVRFNIIVEDGEFPMGSLYAYGERLETQQEANEREARKEQNMINEIDQAKARYESLIAKQPR